jgi:ATP-dependent RNA helicase A
LCFLEPYRIILNILFKTNNLQTTIPASYHPGVRKALERMDEREIPMEMIEALLMDIAEKGKDGAVLVFLPGWNLIQMLLTRLEQHTILGWRYLLFFNYF